MAWVAQTILVKVGLKDPAYIPSPRYKSEGFRIEEMVSLASGSTLGCVLNHVGTCIQGPINFEKCEDLVVTWYSL